MFVSDTQGLCHGTSRSLESEQSRAGLQTLPRTDVLQRATEAEEVRGRGEGVVCVIQLKS